MSDESEDDRDVNELIRELRGWQGPGSAGVSRSRDRAFWAEAAKLLLEYLELHVGADALEPYRDGLYAWVLSSPGALLEYSRGDDMARAGLVDRYLRETREARPGHNEHRTII
jgi:hypothetical protein